MSEPALLVDGGTFTHNFETSRAWIQTQRVDLHGYINPARRWRGSYMLTTVVLLAEFSASLASVICYRKSSRQTLDPPWRKRDEWWISSMYAW